MRTKHCVYADSSTHQNRMYIYNKNNDPFHDASGYFLTFFFYTVVGMLFLRHCSLSTALMCLRVSEEEVLGIVLEETNGSVGENTGLSSQSSKSRFYCPKERAGL